jgi:magnesium transporter
MIHRMLRYPAGWEWHVLHLAKHKGAKHEPLPSRKQAHKHAGAMLSGHKAAKAASTYSTKEDEKHAEELKQQFPDCVFWLDECRGRRNNVITVADTADLKPLLYGTLMLQISEDQADVQPFHFWLSERQLVTAHDDMRIPLRLQSVQHESRIGTAQTAPEALFVMIGIILETFHEGLDGFEKRLGELEITMRQENRTGLIDDIFERRYDLLHWSHLFIPVREVHGAAKEAFMDKLTETEGFIRITHKLERIESLLKHYSLEIDTLISMDDATANFRGNDIMKTLTIFTVLVLPATIAGSLWGTNFKLLAWEEEPLGFPVMIIVIIVLTLLIYGWLWKKGWTGDLLNNRKSATTGDSNPAQGQRSRSSSRKSARSKKAAKAIPQADAPAAPTIIEDRRSRSKQRL